MQTDYLAASSAPSIRNALGSRMRGAHWPATHRGRCGPTPVDAAREAADRLVSVRHPGPFLLAETRRGGDVQAPQGQAAEQERWPRSSWAPSFRGRYKYRIGLRGAKDLLW